MPALMPYCTRFLRTCAVLALLFSVTCLVWGRFSPVSATIDRTINFQSRIVNKTNGLNLVAGSPACVKAGADTCDFQVRFWNHLTNSDTTPGSGNLMFTQTFQDVEIGDFNGIFNLVINSCGSAQNGNSEWGTNTGSCTVTDDSDADSDPGVDFNRDDLYIEIGFATADTTGSLGSFAELFSRKKTNSVPSALYAETATTLEGITSSGFVQLQPAAAQTATGAQALIYLNETGGSTPNLLQLQVAGNDSFVVENDNTLRLGTGATTNAIINLYGSDGDTGSLEYTTNDSFYFNGGSVGIGANNPTSPLTVYGLNTNPGRFIRDQAGSGAVGVLSLDVLSSTVNDGVSVLLRANDSLGNITEYARIASTIEVSGDGAETGNLRFMTTNAGSVNQERMRITGAGDVGIGVTNPTAFLDIKAATTANAQINFTTSAGVNTSVPVSGDLWWNGTNLFFYNGTTNIDVLAGGTGALFTDGGTVTYLTSLTDDFAIGSTSLVAPFSVDESLNTVRIGEGSGSNAILNMFASDGDTGSITYSTADGWAFTGGNASLGSVGTIVPEQTVTVDNVFTNTSGDLYAGVFRNQAEAAGASTALHYGVYGQARADTVNGPNTLVGVRAIANINAAATVPNVYGLWANASLNDTMTGSVTNTLTAIYVDSPDAEDATSVAVAEGIRLTTPSVDTGALTTGYGVRVLEGTRGAGTFGTQYGLHLALMDNATNNYGIWGDGGDWILDENGNGTIGGNASGGDLALGELQEYRMYFNGTNSYALSTVNNLYLGADSGSAGSQIQFGDEGATNVYGYFITGSTNTGDFAVDTNTLYVDASVNRVGINTSAPTQSLDARTADSITTGEHITTYQGNVGATAGILTGWYADGAANTGGYVRSVNSLPLFLGTSSTNQAVTIANGGNVGISSLAPGEKLVVGGARPITLSSANATGAGYGVNLQASVGGWAMDFDFKGSSGTELGGYGALGTSDALVRYYIGTVTTDEKLSILANGNIGIGVIGPTAFLDIKAATTAAAQINLTTSAGVNPSAPVNGDLWWNGTNLNFYNGTITTDLLGQANLFTDGGATTYLTSLTDDFAIGSTSLVAPFSVDESLNTVRIGEGSGSNAILNMFASDGDTGSLEYTTNDGWFFNGGNVGVGVTSGTTHRVNISATSGLFLLGMKETASSAAAVVTLDNDLDAGIRNVVYGSTYAAGSVFGVGANGSVIYSTSAGTFGIGTFGVAQPLILATNSTEKVRIESGGRVGVGDITPDALLDFDFASTATTGATEYGAFFTTADTGVVTTGTDTTYGLYNQTTRTGATGGTINTYGDFINLTTDNAGAGTHNAYGLYVNLDGSADNNYPGIFMGGNVGIGRIDPGYKLHVYGTGNDVTSGSIHAQNPTDGTGAAAIVNVTSGTTNSASGYLGAFSNSYTAIPTFTDRLVVGANSTATGITLGSTAVGQDIRFLTGGAAEVARIDSSGNLGIGVTVPNAFLDIKAATTAAAQINLTTSAGVNPSAPVNGDLWWNGTNLDFYNGTVTTDLLGQANLFTDGGTITYRTDLADDFAVGSTTLVAPFSVDESLNTVRIGEGSGTNGILNMYANDGDTGSLEYTTSDGWYFNGGNVGIGTNAATTVLDIIGGNAAQIRLRNVATDATLKNGYIQVGHYTNAEEDFGVIVANANSTTSVVNIGGGSSVLNTATQLSFFTAANTTTLTGTETLRLNLGVAAITGTLDVSGHGAFGANAAVDATRTLNTIENYTSAGSGVTTISGFFSQTRTEASTITADTNAKGVQSSLTYAITEDLVSPFHGDAYAFYGDVNTSGANTYRQLMGAHFQASSTSTAATDQDSLYGARTDAFINSTGTVTNVYGTMGRAYATAGTVTSGIGLRGHTFTNGASGTVTTGYGVYGLISEGGGSVTTGYGVYGQCLDATACYGLRAQATDADPTTNYGLFIDASGAVTNNYGIWGETGDWILAENGGGSAGGTTGLGDLMLGASQQYKFYFNGTNAYSLTTTNNLYLGADSGSAGSQIQFGDEGATNVYGYFITGSTNTGDFAVDTNTLYVDASADSVGIGVTAPTAFLDIKAATTAAAQINLTTSAGVNPSAPVSGDLWWNGTNLDFYNGSATTDLLAQANLFTDGGTVTYRTDLADDFAVGSTTLVAPFSVDESLNTVRIGEGSGSSAILAMYASDGDTGTLEYTTNDSFYFNNGNVGVGTNNPNAKLQVLGSASETALVNVNSNSAQIAEITFNFTASNTTDPGSNARVILGTGGASAGDPYINYNIAGVQNWSVGIDNSDSDSFKIDNQIGLSTAAELTILTGGNVGIGVNTPATKLHVDGGSVRIASGGQLQMFEAGNTSGSTIQSTAAGNLVFSTSAAERFRISGTEAVMNDPGNDVDFRVEGDNDANLIFVDAGNDRVGIGLNNPASKLHASETRTDTSGSFFAAQFNTLFSGAASTAILTAASSSASQFSANGITTLRGYFGGVSISNSGTVSNGYGVTGSLNFNTTGTITTGIGFLSQLVIGASQTANMTNHYYAYLGSNSLGGGFVSNITNQHGLYIADINLGTTSNYAIRTNAGLVVFNEGGDATTDFRVEGDTDANLFFTDASADRVGIGVAVPDAFLDIKAATTGSAQLNLTTSAGVNPSAPVSGDLWWNGTNLNFYNGTVTTDLLGQANLFTDGGATTYLTSQTDDFAIGSTSLAAPFSVDESLNTVRIGEGSGSNANLNMYASDGDTGSITYNTSDQWAFTGGDISVTGHVFPGADNTYDLGSDVLRWRSLYVSGASIHLGSTGDGSVLGYDTTSDEIRFSINAGTNIFKIDATGNINIGTAANDRLGTSAAAGLATSSLYWGNQRLCQENGTNCPAGAAGVSLNPGTPDVVSAATGNSVYINNTGEGGNLLNLQDDGTTVFQTTTEGNTTIGNVAAQEVDLKVYGDVLSAANSELMTGMGTVVDTFIYDTTKDSDSGKWTNDELAKQLSWYKETKDDGPGDACSVSTDDRCGKSEFPKKAILVVTQTNLYILDAVSNKLWMRFDQSANYALGVDATNSPSSVTAQDGKIYVSMNSTVAFGIVEIDYKLDKVARYAVNEKVPLKSAIADRNSSDASRSLTWSPTQTGTGVSQVNKVFVDSSNNIYATGYYQTSSVDFGGGSMALNCDFDYFVVKYNSDGVFQWSDHTDSGTATCQALGLGLNVDSSGNVYVTGRFSNAAVDFGSGSWTPSGNDYFVVKYNSSGTFQWADREDTGTGSVVANAVTTDTGGNVYVAGSFQTAAVDFGTGSLTPTGIDYFIVKYNSSGTVLLVDRENSGTGNATVNSITTDSSDNVYATGTFDGGTIDFGSGALVPVGTDYFVLKHNSSLTFQWVDNENSGTGSATAVDLAVDSSANVYVVGFFDTASLDFGAGSWTPTGTDYFVVKYNTSGTFQWADRENAGSGNARGWAVTTDTQGYVYVGGDFSSSAVDFGVGSWTPTGFEPFLIKYDPTTAEIKWATRGGDGAGTGRYSSLDADSQGNIYAGDSSHSGSPDMGVGKINKAYFLRKIGQPEDTRFQTINSVSYSVHVSKINGKTYLASGTNAGMSVINLSDAHTYSYSDVTNNLYYSVWLTKSGRLYGTNGASSQLEKWKDVHLDTASEINGTPDMIYNGNSTPPLTFGGPSFSGSGNSLFVQEGASDKVYVASDKGVTRLTDIPGAEADGSVKYYASSYISDELVGDSRLMVPLDGWGEIPVNSLLGGQGVFDVTRNGNNGFVSVGAGTTPNFVSGVRATALEFDGGDYICTGSVGGTCADAAPLDFAAATQFSISLWFKFTGSVIAQQALVSKGGLGGNIGYTVYTDTAGKIVCGIDDDTTFGPDYGITSALEYDDNSWHHVVCEKIGTGAGDLKMFMDGQATGVLSGTMPTGTLDNTVPFRIGANGATSPAASFIGQIDEIGITAEQLTQSQIWEMYQTGRNASSSRHIEVTDATTFSSTTIGDSAETWTPGEFVGSFVEIMTGTGPNQTRQIIANTATTLTVSPAWATTPDATSDFAIMPHRFYMLGNGAQSAMVVGNYMYVAAYGSNAGGVSVIDLNSDTIKRIIQGASGFVDESGVAWDGTSGYDNVVSVSVDQSLSVFAGEGGNILVEKDEKSFSQLVSQLENLTGSGAGAGTLKDTTYQNDTISYPVSNQVVRKGWGFVGAITNTTATDTVNFGMTFDSPPVVLVSAGGEIGTSPAGPSSCTAVSAVSTNVPAMGYAVTTTGFTARVGTASTSVFVCYNWIAIGTSTSSYGADLAENYLTRDLSTEAGDVVSIDPNYDISVVRSRGAMDDQAIGVVSTQPGMTLGPTDGTTPGVETTISGAEVAAGEAKTVPIALSGRVPVKVTLENGPIKKGDFLTPASKAGYAMKAITPGISIGRAMEDFDGSSSLEAVLDAQAVVDAESQIAQLDYSTLTTDKFGEGKIMVFVNTGYFWGGSGVNSSNQNSGADTEVASNDQITTQQAGVLGQYVTITPDAKNIGNNVLGSLIFKEQDSSISSIGKPLRFQSLSDQDVEFYNGQIKLNAQGQIVAVEVKAGTVTTTNLNIEGSVKALTDGRSAIGTVVIPAGGQNVQVNNSLVTASSLIFINPEELVSYRVVDKIAGQGFSVLLNSPTDKELRINYIIVN